LEDAANLSQPRETYLKILEFEFFISPIKFIYGENVEKLEFVESIIEKIDRFNHLRKILN
jgi:hypothetical protein